MPFSVDEHLIVTAERELGQPFPAPMRTRLLRNNGGQIAVGDEIWRLLPVWDPSDEQRMKRTNHHMVRKTRQMRTHPHFPKEGVVIAENSEGQFLILRPGAESPERWNRETGECTPVSIRWD